LKNCSCAGDAPIGIGAEERGHRLLRLVGVGADDLFDGTVPQRDVVGARQGIPGERHGVQLLTLRTTDHGLERQRVAEREVGGRDGRHRQRARVERTGRRLSGELQLNGGFHPRDRR